MLSCEVFGTFGAFVGNPKAIDYRRLSIDYCFGALGVLRGDNAG
jgi:hypothetical protein